MRLYDSMKSSLHNAVTSLINTEDNDCSFIFMKKKQLSRSSMNFNKTAQ